MVYSNLKASTFVWNILKKTDYHKRDIKSSATGVQHLTVFYYLMVDSSLKASTFFWNTLTGYHQRDIRSSATVVEHLTVSKSFVMRNLFYLKSFYALFDIAQDN